MKPQRIFQVFEVSRKNVIPKGKRKGILAGIEIKTKNIINKKPKTLIYDCEKDVHLEVGNLISIKSKSKVSSIFSLFQLIYVIFF